MVGLSHNGTAYPIRTRHGRKSRGRVRRAESAVGLPRASIFLRGPGYGTRLSPREREVAELAAHGHTNQHIARTLNLSTRTVEQHVARALHKLGATSRYDLHVVPGTSPTADVARPGAP